MIAGFKAEVWAKFVVSLQVSVSAIDESATRAYEGSNDLITPRPSRPA